MREIPVFTINLKNPDSEPLHTMSKRQFVKIVFKHLILNCQRFDFDFFSKNSFGRGRTRSNGDLVRELPAGYENRYESINVGSDVYYVVTSWDIQSIKNFIEHVNREYADCLAIDLKISDDIPQKKPREKERGKSDNAPVFVGSEKIKQISELLKKAHEMSILRGYEDVKDYIFDALVQIKQIEEISAQPDVSIQNARTIHELHALHNVDHHSRYISPSSGLFTETRQRIDENKRDDINMIAYFLSKYGHESLFPNLGQYETMLHISEMLGIKHTTLKNLRDMYDSHTGSHRKGWQTPLSVDMQKTFVKCESMSRSDLADQIRAFLSLHSSNNGE